MSRFFVLTLALLNGILYCCVLPLWEGFDEPFHYAYVESIADSRTIPVMNRTPVSREIRNSLDDVPLSRLLSEAIPGSLSFEEWSRLTEPEKAKRRSALQALTPAMRIEGSGMVNYESQQAPLAYLVYAPFEKLLSRLTLPERILWLRLLGTIAATFSIFFALERLAIELGLDDSFKLASLAVVFEGQMLWASIAHVGNDVFAIPLSIWFLTWLVVTAEKSTARNLLILCGIFAAGLLTKAYFLAFAPLLLVFIAWLVLSRRTSATAAALGAATIVLFAAPWYARNLFLYRSLSGTQQSAAGIGTGAILAAFMRIPWARSVVDFATWSLWTGNWSFVSFSKLTLRIELLLLGASFVSYVFFLRHASKSQWWLLFASASFGGGLIYQTCATWVHTHGESTFAEPWYAQGVMAVLIVLGFQGLSRLRTAGRCIAGALAITTAWVLAMTYLAKLLPYYGAGLTRSNFRTVWSWWNAHPTQDLTSVLLAPVPLVYLLLVTVLVLLSIVSGRIILQLLARRARERA